MVHGVRRPAAPWTRPGTPLVRRVGIAEVPIPVVGPTPLIRERRVCAELIESMTVLGGRVHPRPFSSRGNQFGYPVRPMSPLLNAGAMRRSEALISRAR